MEKNQIEFNYNGVNTIIQCKEDEKLKDIFQTFKIKINSENKILIYMYNGIIIQYENLTFIDIANSEDKKRKKMNILVIEGEVHPVPEQDLFIKSNNIICPKCKEDIKFKNEDYVINLFECKNKHDINNIFLDEFDSTQNINISKIICQICRKYNKGNVHNNIFYKCNTCIKDLCPICYSSHEKNHNVINYDNKNYICEQHNKAFISYCKDCKENACIYCEQNHNKHNIMSYGKLLPDDDKMKNISEQLEKTKERIINDINEMIEKLNDIKDSYIKYSNIFENIINNFNREKINYEILYNINHINDDNMVKDINNVIIDNNIQNKFNKLINIYNKINNKISIIYNINKNDKEIKVFDGKFVENNFKNCIMIIDNKEYKLSDKFNIQNYNQDKITIKLKGIKNITDMSYMFRDCESLLSISDISKWSTSNINNMSHTFGYCKSLISLPDISKWNTSNVNDMSYMFRDCESLISIPDISKWNTLNVNDMSYIFSECSRLLSLPDISKWNTSNVNNMSNMFYNCSSLLSIPDISKWDTTNVIYMGYMFYECSSLISLPDISK